MASAVAVAIGVSTPANAAILAPVRNVVASLAAMVANEPAGASPSPSPTPSGPVLPSATPTPKAYRASRGGPFLLSLNGSLALGTHTSSQTLYNGFGPAPSPSASGTPSPFYGSAFTTSQSQQLGSLGLYGEASRRTATSSLDLRVPFAFSLSNKALFGTMQAVYSTSRYAVGYGPQNVALFGQLPAGSTIRSVYGILPVPRGDVTVINGPTIGALGEQIPLQAIRWRTAVGRELYELGFMRANGPETGDSKTLLVGAAASRGAATAIAEAAFQSRQNGDNSVGGPSYQARVDDGSNQSYVTAIARHMASGFVSFGVGEIPSDNYLDFSYHKTSDTHSFSLDTSSEQIGLFNGTGTQTNRQTNVSYGGPFHLGSYVFSLQSQRSGGTDAPTEWTGTETMQVSAGLGQGFLLFGNTLSRITSDVAGNQSTNGSTLAYQVPIRLFSLGVQFGNFRQTSQALGSSATVTEGFNLSRQIGRKTSVQFSDTFSHAVGVLSNALLTNAQIAIARTISPALTLQMGYGVQTLNDRLNPSSNGRTRSFNLQVNAPFSYGNGLVTGRSDPHLPATIVGRVLTDASSNPTYAGLVSSGVSNVLVILDDKTIERTDVTGGFQFSFVSPGQHQLRIENSSLPRGVTVDIPINTIVVDGGQTAQVTFFVGDFGGISGHVYGRDDSGAIVPLPNVMLRVDGGTYSQTDQTGTYGFGRLHPGKHVVTIIENTVPAFAAFDASKEKVAVDVKNGEYTQLDFSAEPLGSITGSVTYGKEMGEDAGRGVPNAYVVAEPGEHAAIVNDDGSYDIDNLPPGDYTVSLDPETLPDGLGSSPESLAITLGSKEHYQGAAFAVGRFEKKVVFSFNGAGGAQAASAPKVSISEHRLPPLGTATIKVDALQSAGPIVAEVFDRKIPLAYSATSGAWTGELTVPTNVKAADYQVTAKAASGTQPQPATLTVDAKMPIAIIQLDPPNPQKGQYVRVRARFLVDVKPGDRIEWEDGQRTTLGKPVAGRVFTLSVRLSLRPLHGLLLTGDARLPIRLM